METPGGGQINREDFGLIVVLIDIAVIISFICFIWFLERGQEKFIEQFEEETIEMMDFTVRVKGMPLDDMYKNDEAGLRAHLIDHFETVVKE
jgi:hypothetical protein